jgi:small GTP-binding protein
LQWDTAGQESFRSIGSSYYRGTSGILVVFDVNDRASFDQLKVMQEGKWLRSTRCYYTGNEQTILVGNKTDTPGTRVVSYEEAMSFAKSLKIPYLETSAKENLGVEEVFRMLVQLVIRGEAMEFWGSTR